MILICENDHYALSPYKIFSVIFMLYEKPISQLAAKENNLLPLD